MIKFLAATAVVKFSDLSSEGVNRIKGDDTELVVMSDLKKDVQEKVKDLDAVVYVTDFGSFRIIMINNDVFQPELISDHH